MVDTEETSTQDLSYDYDSIMHYDAYAFSSNDGPTLTPVDSSVGLERLGQRGKLSERDKEHIRILYKSEIESELNLLLITSTTQS